MKYLLAAAVVVLAAAGIAITMTGGGAQTATPPFDARHSPRANTDIGAPSPNQKGSTGPTAEQRSVVVSSPPEVAETPPPVSHFELTDADVELIKRNVHDLYANADLPAVMEGLREAERRYPAERIDALHAEKRASGEYEVLNAPKAVPGESITIPKVAPSPQAFGLVQVHTMADGTFVKTTLSRSELGRDARIAVEHGALYEVYARVARAR